MFRKRKFHLAVVLTLVTIFMTMSTALTSTYIGSSQSNKFHYEDCRAVQKIKPANIVYFGSRDEAVSADYSPCGICHP